MARIGSALALLEDVMSEIADFAAEFGACVPAARSCRAGLLRAYA